MTEQQKIENVLKYCIDKGKIKHWHKTDSYYVEVTMKSAVNTIRFPLNIKFENFLSRIKEHIDIDLGIIYTKKQKDVDNHPERYNGNSPYECYKVLKAWMSPQEYKGFLRGNCLKYLCRLGKKDEELKELKKASWYLNQLIEDIDEGK